jgi:hypothetical protein
MKINDKISKTLVIVFKKMLKDSVPAALNCNPSAFQHTVLPAAKLPAILAAILEPSGSPS